MPQDGRLASRHAGVPPGLAARRTTRQARLLASQSPPGSGCHGRPEDRPPADLPRWGVTRGGSLQSKPGVLTTPPGTRKGAGHPSARGEGCNGRGPRNQLRTPAPCNSAPPLEGLAPPGSLGVAMHSHHRLKCVDNGGKRVYTLRPRRVESDAWMKRCSRCGQTLPLEQFNRNRSRGDGLQTWCRECRRKNRDKVGSSVLSRARKYRLNRDEVAALLQVPACQCCGLPFVSESDMQFDHCHEGGHVRGVICQPCNNACHGPAIEAVSRLEDCKRYLLRDLEGQCEHARAS